MDTFKQLVSKDLENLNDKQVKNNLSTKEKEILPKLRKNKEIVIKERELW